MVFCILDAARMGFNNIEVAKDLNPAHKSLYSGGLSVALATVAPYLFACQESEQFVRWLYDSGFGSSWGVFFYSQASTNEIYRHLRKYLLVQTEAGKELYFRFYDPRVLKVFLPTCNKAQLNEFFGPIKCFALEDEDPKQAIVFSLKEGVLHSEVIPAEMLLAVKSLPIESGG